MKMKNGVVMLLGVCGLSWISMAAVAAEAASADVSNYTSNIKVCGDVFCTAPGDPQHGGSCLYDMNTSGKYAIYKEVQMKHDVPTIGIAVCMQTCDEGGNVLAQACGPLQCSTVSRSKL